MTLLAFIPISPNNNSTISFLANDPYIDTFWLPFLGPTATLLLHHLMTKALCETQEFEIIASELSSHIGVGNRDGTSSPMMKNLKRLCNFGLISNYNEKFYIPTNIEILPLSQLRKHDVAIQGQHQDWIEKLKGNPLNTQRQKARFLFISLQIKSVNSSKIHTALSRSGLHPSIIGETIKQLTEKSTAA